MALEKQEIKTVQRWLGALLGLPTLSVTGTLDAATADAIKAFKTAVGITPVDEDLEDLGTWSTLCDAAAWELLDDDVHGPKPVETWARLTGHNWARDAQNARFLNLVSDFEDAHGDLKDIGERGLILLLHYLESDPDITDLRWAAYMLATAQREARQFQPIEEDRALWTTHVTTYAKLQPYTSHAGVTTKHRYYGRGYVQLTWLDHYEDMSQILFGDDRLPAQPELALEPDTAYLIFTHGMRNGFNGGRRISEFLTDTATDYVRARQVVNGTDAAAEIAGHAQSFERWLRARGFEFRGPALDHHVRKHEVEVSTVQRWLKDLLALPDLPISGKFDDQTTAAVKAFQRAVNSRRLVPADERWRFLLQSVLGELFPPTGAIDMFTWTALADAGAWRIWNRDPAATGSRPVDAWEQKTGDDLAMSELAKRCSDIASKYEKAFHAIDDAAKRGMLLLFFYLKNDPAIPDVRVKAYLLATAKHDCAGAWWPTKRRVKGQKKYVSRGYVELSGEDNYRAASQAIFSDDRLVTDPELAMQPDVAYEVMSSMMLHGFLTPAKKKKHKTSAPTVGPKLGDFIHDSTADYVSARTVVKKGDKDAKLIAEYAKKFEVWLKAP